MALHELGFERGQRGLQASLRQARAAGQGLRDIVQAEHVAPYQPRRFRGAVAAQQHRPVAAMVGMQLRRLGGRGVVVGQQAHQQARLPHERVDREIAGLRDAA